MMSGVFQTENGELGVFVVNTSKENINFSSNMNLPRHGLKANSVVDVDKITPDGKIISVHRRVKGKVHLNATIPGHTIFMYHIKLTGN
jgi:hypothetical protein